MTPYAEHLRRGATEDVIASLLKRQHQVVIAAIRAGRIEDLIRHSNREKPVETASRTAPKPAKESETPPGRPPAPQVSAPERAQASSSVQPTPTGARTSGSLGATGGLNLDEVISDYLRRSSEQGRLDLKVLAPNAFIAGKSVGLTIQVSYEAKPEPGAIVTVKIIGTAFKPQVFLGRTSGDGVVNFSLALPAFTAGTAAIVIEAQSSKGRGELKHLIRRA
jgi:hypothetical protein